MTRPDWKLITALVYIALNFAIFSLFDTYLAIPLFFAVPLLFGFVVGERWAILLALTLIPVAGAYPDLGEGGASQTMAYAALFGVPLTALVIAIGVALRKLLAPREARRPMQDRGEV